MRAETPAGGAAGPWERTCRDLAARLESALDGIPVAVAALGVRDELSDVFEVPGPDAVPVHLYGQHAVVGPLPGGGGPGPARPCGRCLARRWQAVRSLPLRDALELGSGTSAAGASPFPGPFAVEALAGLIAAALGGRDGAVRERGGAGRARSAAGPAGRGAAGRGGGAAGSAPGGPFPDVYLMDLGTLQVRRHPLVPDPECPVCGGEAGAEGVRSLEPGAAPEHAPGSFRVRPLEAYGIAVEAFANPVCGALGPSVVYDVSSTSTSAAIGCFSMRSGAYLRETFWGGHADTFHDSARIGVLEGLERYAGMRARSRITRVAASLDALRADGEDPVDPRDAGLYAPEFHRDNPRVAPFTPDREIPWVWGWSLRDHRPRLVPEVLTYYHAPGLENRFVQESSNGCASGGCLEEAAYHGLMEVVERDAFLLTWFGRASLPEIDPATSRRAHTRHMVDRLAMYGYRARFFDTRITFPVPVVTGVAVREDGGLGAVCFGAGAGLDPEAALAGALCEIATDAVNLRGRTEREEGRLRAMAEDFDNVAALHDHPLAYGIPEMARHASFLLDADAPALPMEAVYGEAAAGGGRRGAIRPSGDVGEDLRACADAVTREGFDVVVVDQTLPEQRDLGLTTVSVLVPGLLPIDFGYRRQRAPLLPRALTALHEAGLRDRPLRPDELNRAPHPFP